MLEPGQVLKLRVEDTTPPKIKYLVIVGCTQDEITIATVFINSNVNIYIAYNAVLQAAHLPILAAEHSFLRYDSHVDCTQIAKRPYAAIEQHVNAQPSTIVGRVTPTLLDEILTALRHSTLIKGKDKKKLGLYDR